MRDDAAFPTRGLLESQKYEFCDNDYPQNGLTKREYFAAMALQGLVKFGNGSSDAFMAEKAVLYADALIEELEK